MKFTQLVCSAILAATGFVATADAQTLRTSETPAEFPPSSYKANQYIDSRGCVYIRAGIDGNTTWVPRVTRERKLLCGMEPTKIAQAKTVAPVPNTVEQITMPAPAPTPAPAAAPAAVAPAPQQTASVQPRPARVSLLRRSTTRRAPTETVATQLVARTPAAVVVAPPVAAQSVTAPVVVAAPAAPKPVVAATPAQVVQTAAPACTGASAVSQKYINTARKGLAVRCGPQQVAPASRSTTATRSVAVTSGVPGAPALSGSTRVVPLHVARNRAQDQDFQAPEGYRAAWQDDRLNPKRAEGTLEGWGRMKLVWTDTVPRRLVDQTSGRDMTGEIALVYPFTSFQTQSRELGQVTFATRNGQQVKRILRKPGAPSAAELAKRAAPVVATRSAPVEAAKPKTVLRAKPAAPKGETLAGKRYVQVGMFGVPANAQAASQRLKRAGLPVRIGKLTKGGTTYRMVLSGPYGDDATAQRALSAARKAGFRDAYLRK